MQMASFSRRSRVAGEPNALTRARAAREARDLPVLRLDCSNPSEVGLGFTHEELAEHLGALSASHYQPLPFGLTAARSAVAREFAQAGFSLPIEQIMLTASTSEAYGFLFKLLCDPGDSVLVPTPSYPLFDMLSTLENVELIPYALAYDGEWHLDMDEIRAALRPNTRAILVVNPNNPTGSYLKRDELVELASLGLPILSDEVFSAYAHREDTRRAHSALLAADKALVFCMGGLSKSLLLPQLKLAWTTIAGPDAHIVQEACERLTHIADTYLSVATPVQLALPSLLAQGPHIREKTHTRVLRNLRAVKSACVDSAVSVLDTEGGWYAILRLPAIYDDEQWALMLLEQDGVWVQPGFYYDLTQGAHLVLSLISEEDVFDEGVRRLLTRVTQAS